MNKKNPTEGKSKYLIASVLLIMLLPLVYVLSVGPAVWLQMNGYLSESVEDALEVIYLPLAWLVMNSEWAEAMLMAYLSLFTDMF
jgi:hypothetical protein